MTVKLFLCNKNHSPGRVMPVHESFSSLCSHVLLRKLFILQEHIPANQTAQISQKSEGEDAVRWALREKETAGI